MSPRCVLLPEQEQRQLHSCFTVPCPYAFYVVVLWLSVVLELGKVCSLRWNGRGNLTIMTSIRLQMRNTCFVRATDHDCRPSSVLL